jgi:hypothetical protein
MQPDEKQPYESPLHDHPVTGGPVVTLSPDENQPPHAEPTTEITAETPSATGEPVRWQASEYIHREKDHVWFVLFILATLVLIAVAIFLIKSLTFAVLIPVMAAALFVYTRRPPRILDYTLSRHGLYINDELFAFGEFKGFALLHGLEQYSIMLVPTKRFKPAISINFPQEKGEAIVDMLAARLPMREVEPDIVDQIIRKLHL